jgi:hypothetical protein
MASLVQDVMNPELFHLRPTDSAEDALNGLLGFGITGAPVLDEAGRPLGMVSLRELAQRRRGQPASEIMSAPAAVVPVAATVTEAARMLAESGHHRLVVVDENGRAAGNVSALDLLRALLGLPPSHPAPFPHFDRSTGLVWSDPAPLEIPALDATPVGPGLIALLHQDAAGRDHVVWAEAVHNVYTRLTDMLSAPQTEWPVLASWLSRGGLRFRAARVDDPAQGREALHRLLGRP